MRENGNCFGTALAKNLHERCGVRNSKTVSASYEKKGTPMSLQEAKQLPRYQANPDAYKHLLEHGARFFSEDDGLEMIVVPSYEFIEKKENKDEQLRSRDLTMDTRVTGTRGDKKKGEKKPKQLSGALLRKTQERIQALTDNALQLSTAACLCNTDEVKKFVPEPLVLKCKDIAQELKKDIEALTSAKDECNRLDVTVLMKETADNLGTAVDVMTSIQSRPGVENRRTLISQIVFSGAKKA